MNGDYEEVKEKRHLGAHGMDFTKGMDSSSILESSKVTKEKLEFETPCFQCNLQGMTRMCICTIPGFKEIIIMAFTCEYCGFKNNEVKSGGAIPQKARKLIFNCEHPSDLDRDVFKVKKLF